LVLLGLTSPEMDPSSKLWARRGTRGEGRRGSHRSLMKANIFRTRHFAIVQRYSLNGRARNARIVLQRRFQIQTPPRSKIVTYSERSGGRVCHTQMKQIKAEMGMEEANESVRGVVGKQRNPIGAWRRVRIVPAKNIKLLKLDYRIRRARKILGYNRKVFAAKCGFGSELWERSRAWRV
jgi:hypothetical protein